MSPFLQKDKMIACAYKVQPNLVILDVCNGVVVILKQKSEIEQSYTLLQLLPQQNLC